MTVRVVKLAIERFHALQNCKADSSRGDGTNVHALDVERPRDTVSDVPPSFQDPLVTRDIVSHESENLHHDVLGDANGITERNLRDRHLSVNGSLKIDMVRSDSGRDGMFKLWALCDSFSSDVRGPKGLKRKKKRDKR